MKSVWSIPLAMALAIAGASVAQAEQRYPAEFANQWQSACLNSCQTNNNLYKGREGVCSAYCTCILEESQANVPLEVAIQADKDLAAKNNNTPAVQKVSQVTNQCQARFPQAQQQQPQQKAGAKKATKTTQ